MRPLQPLLIASVVVACGCAGHTLSARDQSGLAPNRLQSSGSNDGLIGVWRIVKFCFADSTGRREPFGASPAGYLIYTPTGQMSLDVARPSNVVPLASDTAGSAEMRHNVRDGYMGYFGRYTITSDSTVVHQVEGGSLPSYARTDRLRRYRITGAQRDTLAIGNLTPGCRVLVRER